MRLYSDKLTIADLRRALPDQVWADIQEIRHPRARKYGWTVYLEGLGERHTRATGHRPIGSYSLKDYPRAATWDDYGIWMSELFKLDPNAKIGNYDGIIDFIATTAKYQPKGMKAPWLNDPAWAEFASLVA